MRLRNTLLLAIVFILLGGYIFLFELQKERKEKSEILLDFKEEDVEEMILSYPQQEIRLQREPSGKWKITQPVQAAADESAVGGILSALQTSRVQRIVEKKPSPEDVKAFGLDNPEVKVLITLQKGKTLPAILVGAKTPLSNSAYVRRGSELGVLLTSASLRSTLEKKLYDLRDKEILSFSPDQVTRLQIRTPKESLVLVKGEKAEWQVETPTKGKSKPGVVAAYLAALGALRAKGFAEDEPKDIKKYGLVPPSVEISLDGKDGKKLGSLLLGSKGGGEYYAKREGSPTVFSVDEFSYNQLTKQPSDFLKPHS